jgi:hypothetical protein
MSFQIQQITAQTASKHGATKAPFHVLDGIFRQLLTEHREAALLFKRLRELKDDEPQKRREYWRELRIALLAHEQAELQEVYKAFEGYPTLQDIVDDHGRKAQRLELLIAELDALPVTATNFRVTLQRLEVAFRQHVFEEESEFFPRARGVMGRDKAEELEIPYRSAKLSLMAGLRGRFDWAV